MAKKLQKALKALFNRSFKEKVVKGKVVGKWKVNR